MTHEQILDLLERSEGAYLSGEELSRQLGVSRAAVWKAVQSLRRAGYEIEARSAQGYRLSGAPDVLDGRELRRCMEPTAVVGREIHCLDTVDSTNSYLKRLGADGAADGTAAVAGEQTAGRGRLGRSFASRAGEGVYLSVLLRPQIDTQRLLPLTGLAAVAVARAIERVAPVEVGIKWTNDLLLDGRKLCGILTELAVEGETGALQYVVLGAGVNVNNERFDGELAPIAVSLRSHTGRRYSRARLAAAMLGELDALYASLLSGDTASYLAEYRRRCVSIGRKARLLWREGEQRVHVEDVDDALGLVVRHDDGTRETIRTGEVSVRGLYGYVD